MPLASLRVTKTETLYDLAVKLFGKVAENLNLKTTDPNNLEFYDDIVLTGTPDSMIFNGEIHILFQFYQRNIS